MARANPGIYSLNAGAVSPEALTRVDTAAMRLACETMENFLPRTLGSSRKRPGTQYIGTTRNNNTSQLIEFVADPDDTALLEAGNGGKLRVWTNGTDLVTRVSVSTTISNGNFSSLTDWSDQDDGGCTSDLDSGQLRLLGTGSARARRRQAVSVSGGDSSKTHAVDIIVTRGPVYFTIGDSTSNENIVPEQKLKTGFHSIAFIPGATTIYITFSSDAAVYRLVDSCQIAAAGTMVLDTPWTGDAIGALQYVQSEDVVFVGAPGVKPQRIERRGVESWSVVDYTADDGPFDKPNLTPISITPSGTSGNITLTASERLFKSGHVGALFRMTHQGQTGSGTLSGDDQYTGSVAVIGSTNRERNINITIAGTWTGTLTLQRAYGEPSGWIDTDTYTANTVTTYQDEYPDETVYYRIGFKTGGHGSGSADVTITFPARQQTGTVRITGVTNSVTAAAEVLTTLGRAEGTTDWWEGSWSGVLGYPDTVAFHDGRLWWGRLDRLFGSVSDAYESFDDFELEGDSAAINRSIVTGPAGGIRWLSSSNRLVAGMTSQEVYMRSSSFDEPLTPSQFTARAFSTRGAASILPAVVDGAAIYVTRNGKRVAALAYSAKSQDYTSRDLSYLNEDITSVGIVRMAVQRNPDTRVWCVLANGDVAVLTYEPEEEVICWSTCVFQQGTVVDVCVLPDANEDRIFFIIERTVSGSPVRYIERLARSNQANGGTSNWTMDCAISVAGSYSAPNTTFAVPHLAGFTVHAWADTDGGKAIAYPGATATVGGGGNVTIAGSHANAVVGIPVRARIKTAKLAYSAQLGSSVTQRKRVVKVAPILNRTHVGGIQFGPNYSTMSRIPLAYEGRTLTVDEKLDDYEWDASAYRTGFGVDQRLYIEANSPWSATLAAMVIDIEQNERGTTPPPAQPGRR